MTRCISCDSEFHAKRSDSVLCVVCKTNGVTVTCVYCGEKYVMPFATYNTYKNSGRVFAHAKCAREHRNKDPEYTAKIFKIRSETAKKVWSNPEHKQKQSESHKKAWTPEMKQKQAETVTARFADPKERMLQSERTAKHFSKVENRQALSAKMKEVCNSKEWKDKRYVEGKCCWDDPEYAEKQSSRIRALFVANQSVCLGDLWGDVEYRSNWLEYRKDKGRRTSRESTVSAISKIVACHRDIRLKSTEADWREAVTWVVENCGTCRVTDLADFTGYHYTTAYAAVVRYNLTAVEVAASKEQASVVAYLESIYQGTIETDKYYDFMRNSLGNRLQLDMYIEEHKLALEFNGTHWHGEKNGKSKNYHYNKSMLCREAGVRLIHIWDYEWNDPRQRPILESIIRSILGLTERIYARKCELYRPSASELKAFETKYHLQGSAPASARFALRFDGNIVASMSFSKPRFNKQVEWELVRLTFGDYAVTGGAERMLAAFIKAYTPQTVISYCDVSKFTGDVYTRIGFEFKEHSKANYKWHKDTETLNRIQCQKHKLVAAGYGTQEQTEVEIMQSRGYERVFDCGNDVYIWRG